MVDPTQAGTLVLVVGPSGAGKDSLLAAARQALASDPHYLFPSRDITRPADAGGEDHNAVTKAEFSMRRDAGDYALSWEANGHGYGVPISIHSALEGGQIVLCNVSRAVIDAARGRYPRMRVLWVTAPLMVLAQRIAGRGRETPDEVAARLSRASYAQPQGADVTIIDNSGSLEDSTAQFVGAIRAVAAQTAR